MHSTLLAVQRVGIVVTASLASIAAVTTASSWVVPNVRAAAEWVMIVTFLAAFIALALIFAGAISNRRRAAGAPAHPRLHLSGVAHHLRVLLVAAVAAGVISGASRLDIDWRLVCGPS